MIPPLWIPRGIFVDIVVPDYGDIPILFRIVVHIVLLVFVIA
jgi:hypothetical protein